MVVLLLMIAFFTWSENVIITRGIKVVGRMGLMIGSIAIYFKIVRYGAVNNLSYKISFIPYSIWATWGLVFYLFCGVQILDLVLCNGS